MKLLEGNHSESLSVVGPVLSFVTAIFDRVFALINGILLRIFILKGCAFIRIFISIDSPLMRVFVLENRIFFIIFSVVNDRQKDMEQIGEKFVFLRRWAERGRRAKTD
jgi:hypothetical protein